MERKLEDQNDKLNNLCREELAIGELAIQTGDLNVHFFMLKLSRYVIVEVNIKDGQKATHKQAMKLGKAEFSCISHNCLVNIS